MLANIACYDTSDAAGSYGAIGVCPCAHVSLYQRSRAMQWTATSIASECRERMRSIDCMPLGNFCERDRRRNMRPLGRTDAVSLDDWQVSREHARWHREPRNVHACSCSAISCSRLPLLVLCKVHLTGALSVDTVITVAAVPERIACTGSD